MNFDDTPHGDDFYVSTDIRRLDMGWVINTLLAQPWGGFRTHENMQDAIQHSICFGLYHHQITPGRVDRSSDTQVGFARVISDRATYSLVVDVVIDERFRGRGLGKFLVGEIVKHPAVDGTVSLLRTNTASSLYSKFGYNAVGATMRRLPTP